MFKLNLSPTFEWPVKFTTIDAAGRQQAHTITMIFRRLDREEMIDMNITDEMPATRLGSEVIEVDLDYLLTFVEGWKDVEIDGDTAFSRDNLRKLLKGVPAIHREITAAFIEAANGGRKKST